MGLGLMGGSLALATRYALPEVEVVGVDFPEVLELVQGKAVHRAYPPAELPAAVADAEVVFLATPIRTILELIPRVSRHMRAGAVLTDLGSTKAEICRVAREHVPPGVRFVGGHPLTGAEGRGFRAADPFLFQNAVYVLTPFPGTEQAASRLKGFLRALGAIVVEMDPEVHDEVAAYVSHLPQLVAVALVNLVGRREGFLEFAAGGFRDLTRVASSPYGIWTDILATNVDKVSAALEEFLSELSRLKRNLGRGLEEEFVRANRLRAAIPRRAKGFLGDLPRIRVRLPDRPGALAAVAGALGEAGINIKDVELLRVREDIGGTFQIYLGTREDAERAARILSRMGYEAEVVD
ncbi:prephenate dehydrogenase/arogenate dehydrogenase family protein [Candidatus Bipolaricaulota sp. J31]